MSLADFYPWAKALHVISVIAWMAGLLYLPRLFVYHADAPPGSGRSETFKVMERRLLRGIATPAMAASFVFGGLMAATPGALDWSTGWVWVKAGALAGLVAAHGLCARWRRTFAADANRRPARFYRFANEAPAALMVVVVLMAVAEPF